MYFYELLAASSEARNVASKLTEAIRDDRNSASNCDILQICIDRLAAVCRIRALSYDFIRATATPTTTTTTIRTESLFSRCSLWTAPLRVRHRIDRPPLISARLTIVTLTDLRPCRAA